MMNGESCLLKGRKEKWPLTITKEEDSQSGNVFGKENNEKLLQPTNHFLVNARLKSFTLFG
jgi:hypothetical protein